jgi:hypothetical protein
MNPYEKMNQGRLGPSSKNQKQLMIGGTGLGQNNQ